MPEMDKVRVTAFPAVGHSVWAAGLFSLALLGLYHQTVTSMVTIWLRSDTFAHGFLILPISLWLIWRRRDELGRLQPRPAPAVALLALLPALAWFVAWLVDVLVVQQLALVAMLVVGVWAILGHQLARALAVPLLFLFLAVPMGEALVLPMMEFTAASTVWLIQQTGIPVYREGLYFSLPSGSWSVVEACSGVRYIIASFTLGVLYAYLTYRSLWRRLLFVLASILVPVLANTIRAYIVVMLGHWSDMRIGTGVDHLIYGWMFFGLVMFLIFWLGAMFREDQDPLPMTSPDPHPAAQGVTPTRLACVVAIALAVSASPLYVSRAAVAGPLSVAAPALPAQGPSGQAGAPWEWRPGAAVAGQATAYYTVDGRAVGLFVQYPAGTTTEGEVVGSSTRFVHPDSGARLMQRDQAQARFNGRSILVDQAGIMREDTQLLAWSWYRIGDTDTSNDYVAKFAEAWTRLRTGASPAYRIVVAVQAPMSDTAAVSRGVLQSFLDLHGAELDAALDLAAQGGR